MPASRMAVVGAGVSGLTCGIVLAEAGIATSIFAAETGRATTSGAAGAIWFPYDCEPREKVVKWALQTYHVLARLSDEPGTGVSMIALRQFGRTGALPIPDWAASLGASRLSDRMFSDGYELKVPLTDTTIYLDYLAERFGRAGGRMEPNVHLSHLEELDSGYDVVVNCAGFGARKLVGDLDLEPHRGQVAIVPKLSGLTSAVVCDDEPLMYAIPRGHDSVFGGTNELTENREVEPKAIREIVAECSRVLGIDPPKIIGSRVGIRPFRKSGVRLERGCLKDGRTVIHHYGHGGSGFTLSWGCAREVGALAAKSA